MTVSTVPPEPRPARPRVPPGPGCRLTASVLTGRIDAQEIMQSLRDLGVKISEQQAEKILKR